MYSNSLHGYEEVKRCRLVYVGRLGDVGMEGGGGDEMG